MYAHQNVLGDHPQIPEQAFLFLPKRAPETKETKETKDSKDSKFRDDFRIGEGKGMRRLLFEGWAEQTYTQYQLQRLKQLDDYLLQKGIKLDSRWDRTWRLRWFLSTGCNLKKCVQDIEIFTEYQNKAKALTFSANIAKYLRQGVYYVAGRDSHYRPILVFDVQKIIRFEMTEEEVLETQTYFFEYVLNNLLIPGQVENWVAVIDAASIGLFSLIGSMKKSFTFLSDTYRSRMFVCYVARVPSSISFLWGIVKKFLDEDTVRKINFFDQQIVEPLLQFCNPSQLEVRFGGTLPNIQEGQCWPPREVSNNYKCEKEPVRLLTREEYTEYYNKKIFYNTKFHIENIVKPPAKLDLRENIQAHNIRRIQKEFKILFDTAEEETIELTPQSEVKHPLNYVGLVRQAKQKKEKAEKQKQNTSSK